MAISSSTFRDLGGAASDLFAGLGASAKGKLQADALRLNAEGTRISASSTRITADSLRTKARGDIAEAENYDRAAALARQNEAYTIQSTRLQQGQLERSITQTIGGQRASVAAAGFAEGGSAGDIMRDSAAQGALAHRVLAQQGAITAAGFEEQALSFATMSKAGRDAAASQMISADKTDAIADRQDALADRQDQLAGATQEAADISSFGGYISSALKGATAAASLFAAPMTGGASLLVGGMFMGGGSPSGYGSG
jgi:hypothetical protein